MMKWFFVVIVVIVWMKQLSLLFLGPMTIHIEIGLNNYSIPLKGRCSDKFIDLLETKLLALFARVISVK